MFLSHNSHNLLRLNHVVVDPAVESAETYAAPRSLATTKKLV